VKNYVSKLTYDNRFDQIILTANTINAIDDDVEPKISLNDPEFNSTIGLHNDSKSVTEFTFKPIKFSELKSSKKTTHTIYFDIDKDRESDFSFEFYFISQEKIKEAVKKAIEDTDKDFVNKKNTKNKIKAINNIQKDEISRFTTYLEIALKNYLGSDKNAQEILEKMKIDKAQANLILESVIEELDGKLNDSEFLNTGFGKVITSVVAVLPKVLPIILAL